MAEFTDYFDSGVLVKIYHLEPGSRSATRRVRKVGPIPLVFLGEMEIRNSLRVLHGRNQIAEHHLVQSLAAMDSDILEGRLARILPEAIQVAATAEKLSHLFSALTLCRTLDLLHVSYALVLKATRFHTGDRRQAKLATKAGLQVSFLSQ